MPCGIYCSLASSCTLLFSIGVLPSVCVCVCVRVRTSVFCCLARNVMRAGYELEGGVLRAEGVRGSLGWGYASLPDHSSVYVCELGLYGLWGQFTGIRNQHHRDIIPQFQQCKNHSWMKEWIKERETQIFTASKKQKPEHKLKNTKWKCTIWPATDHYRRIMMESAISQ